MSYEIERDALVAETNGVLDAITDPIFINAMRDFRANTGEEARINFARDNLTPNSLTAMGVSLPEGMRVSSRTFEEGDLSQPQFVDYEEGRRVLDLIRNNRPDLIEALRIEDRDIYDDLIRLDDLLGPENANPLIPDDGFNPEAAGGCACGGAATVCGGAGGST